MLFTQKCRKRQHAVGIGSAGCTAHRPARFRRNIDEIGPQTGRSAFGKIEPETEVVQYSQFEPHEQLTGIGRIMQIVEYDIQSLIEMRVRVSLGQKPQQGTHGLNAIDRCCGFHQLRRTQLQRFDAVFTEMVMQTCTPDDIHSVARLQHRLHAARPAGTNHSKITATRTRHHLGDHTCLAVALYAQNDCLVLPLHREVVRISIQPIITDMARKRYGSRRRCGDLFDENGDVVFTKRLAKQWRVREIFGKSASVAVATDKTERHAIASKTAGKVVTFAIGKADIKKHAVGTLGLHGVLRLRQGGRDHDRFYSEGLENGFNIERHQIFILNDDNPLRHHVFFFPNDKARQADAS